MKAREEVGNRGWNSWMPSSIQGTWVWANSGNKEGKGSPGVLQSTRSQKSDMTWQLNNNIFFIVYEYCKLSRDLYDFLQIYSFPYFNMVKNRIYISPSIITSDTPQKPASIQKVFFGGDSHNHFNKFIVVFNLVRIF